MRSVPFSVMKNLKNVRKGEAWKRGKVQGTYLLCSCHDALTACGWFNSTPYWPGSQLAVN